MFLVAGPPCGGKTTYVEQHRRPGQVVLDFDDLIEELGGVRYEAPSPLVRQAHDLWMARVGRADWVIHLAPTRVQRGRLRSMLQAEVVVVMATMQVCLDRASASRPPTWERQIRRWFMDFEPSRSGKETIVHTDQG